MTPRPKRAPVTLRAMHMGDGLWEDYAHLFTSEADNFRRAVRRKQEESFRKTFRLSVNAFARLHLKLYRALGGTGALDGPWRFVSLSL